MSETRTEYPSKPYFLEDCNDPDHAELDCHNKCKRCGCCDSDWRNDHLCPVPRCRCYKMPVDDVVYFQDPLF